MTKARVKCWRCQRVDASTIEPDAAGWRRLAQAMLRGIEPEEDRKPSMH
jgi:hypothetical protein